MQAKIKKFGTLYLDGRPVRTDAPISYPDGQVISIKDTVPGMEIEWVACGNTLVTRRPLLYNISWVDLLMSNLNTCPESSIDGAQVRVKLPQIGKRADQFLNSDWAIFFQETIQFSGEKLWPEDPNTSFWGQEPYGKSSVRCSVCGADLSHWCCEKKDSRSERIGWRPWLELLRPDPQELLGVPVSVSFDYGAVSGILVNSNEYELVLRSRGGIDGKYVEIPGSAVLLDEDQIIIDRKCIDWMIRRWSEPKHMDWVAPFGT